MFVVEYGRLGLIGGSVITAHYTSKEAAEWAINFVCAQGYTAVVDW